MTPLSEQETLARRIAVATGREKADLVIRNVDLYSLITGGIVHGDIAVAGNVIAGIGSEYRGETELDGTGLIAVPGFIDSHVHLESTMLLPSEFDRLVVPHGVTTAISDPHELANVAGVAAIEYFLAAAAGLVLDLKVQLPSCVPATEFETSGARLTAADLAGYFERGAFGLAEVMNVPALTAGDPEMLAKLVLASGRIVDGHCPLVGGRILDACLVAGVRNCHESSLVAEAMEKLEKGMTLLIREGSVGCNLEALAPLLNPITSVGCAFCSDDRNLSDIIRSGHIDYMIRRVIELGGDPLSAYRAASWSAARAFGLFDRGLVAPGQRADIVLLRDLGSCAIERVIAGGRPVDAALFDARPPAPSPERFLHSVHRLPVAPADFVVRSRERSTPVIGVSSGSLITEKLCFELEVADGVKCADPARGVLKLAVLERHGINGNIGRGFVHGFGGFSGALASTVGHDSHNLCVVGSNDADMAVAVNALIASGGGFSAVSEGEVAALLPLEVGGLISARSFPEVLEELERVHAAARRIGCLLEAPFEALSFLALPVIPHLRLTDRGLFDADDFCLMTE